MRHLPASVAIRRMWVGPPGREVAVWQRHTDMSLMYKVRPTTACGDQHRDVNTVSVSSIQQQVVPLGTAHHLAWHVGNAVDVWRQQHGGHTCTPTLVELGAGCGLVGLVAAVHHHAKVVLTDRYVAYGRRTGRDHP